MREIETISGRKSWNSPGPVAVDVYQATCPAYRVLEPRLQHVAQAYHGRPHVYRVDIDPGPPGGGALLESGASALSKLSQPAQ